MEPLLLISLVAVLVLVVGLSIWSGRTQKKGNSQMGSAGVMGMIVGTIVGGSSTVGTAQLAYTYGLSAWWFTLGSGAACLVLALCYAKPWRRSGCATIMGIVRREFGEKVGLVCTILSTIGTFISVICQVIAATAVIAVVFPQVHVVPAAIFSAAFMVLYVIFGGTKSAGTVGLLKTVLLYVTAIGCGALMLWMVGGFGNFVEMVNGIHNPEGVKFLSFFARGAGTDLGAGLSVILGVVTTQSYAQALLSAKSDRCAQKGALISALLIPPIGAGGVLVGLYMRANAALYPGLTAKTALTTFVTAHMPPVLAGVILAALFVTVVGGGAGISLGIASTISNDLIKRMTRKFDDPKQATKLSRVLLVIILAAAAVLATGPIGDVILLFSFMSMGLRGAVVFVPLLCAMWLPGRIDKRYALVSAIVGPILVLVFGLLDVLPFDPLFLGILASILIMGCGYAVGRKTVKLQ